MASWILRPYPTRHLLSTIDPPPVYTFYSSFFVSLPLITCYPINFYKKIFSQDSYKSRLTCWLALASGQTCVPPPLYSWRDITYPAQVDRPADLTPPFTLVINICLTNIESRAHRLTYIIRLRLQPPLTAGGELDIKARKMVSWKFECFFYVFIGFSFFYMFPAAVIIYNIFLILSIIDKTSMSASGLFIQSIIGPVIVHFWHFLITKYQPKELCFFSLNCRPKWFAMNFS